MGREVDAVKQRVIEIVDNRPFVFRDTPKKVVDEYLRELKAGIGLDSKEIDYLEKNLGVKFDAEFRQYLLNYGKKKGILFSGMNIDPMEFGEYHNQLEEMIEREDCGQFINERTVVFMNSQGVSYYFFEACGGDKSAIYCYDEGESDCRKIAESFSELVNHFLDMKKSVDDDFRKDGGYYISVNNSVAASHHPAMSSNVKPIEVGDRFPFLDRFKESVTFWKH